MPEPGGGPFGVVGRQREHRHPGGAQGVAESGDVPSQSALKSGRISEPSSARAKPGLCAISQA